MIEKIILVIPVALVFYLIGRWLSKDERMAEKEGREQYRLEQEELNKKFIVNKTVAEEKKREEESLSIEKFFKKHWVTIFAILILLSPILFTLFQHFVLGIRFWGEGPGQCWGGQSCY